MNFSSIKTRFIHNIDICFPQLSHFHLFIPSLTSRSLNLRHLCWNTDIGYQKPTLENVLMLSAKLRSLSLKTSTPFHFFNPSDMRLPLLSTLQLYTITTTDSDTKQLAQCHFPTLKSLLIHTVCRPPHNDVNFINSIKETLTSLEFVYSMNNVQIILDLLPNLKSLTFHIESTVTDGLQHSSLTALYITGFLKDGGILC